MDRFVGTVVSVLVGLLVSLPAFGADVRGAKVVTLIHIGDIHGHLVSQPNLRDDPTGGRQGGLARLYTKIKEIREQARPDHTLLINTGDTIQGSAEALFTKGLAVVEVLNHKDLFHIDAFAPGNWDFVYPDDNGLPGPGWFKKLFVKGTFANPPACSLPGECVAPWTALAANAYYSSKSCPPLLPPQLPMDATLKDGPRLLPPYVVKSVAGLKIGILGFTTDRGPQVVGTNVTQGICFTKGDLEVPFFVDRLRRPKSKVTVSDNTGGEAVDLVVMISELGLANNIRLAEKFPGIDVILSSDMHERTLEPVVVTSTGTTWTTIITEAGDGGTMLVRLDLKVQPGNADKPGIKDWSRTVHIITSDIAEDPDIKAAVEGAEGVRATFVTGNFCQPTDPTCTHHVNPFNGTKLQAPIDTVVGYTTIPLHRANFSHLPPATTDIPSMPAVIEGSSHDFLTDAFRVMTGADIGGIRGFRYGTHVGPTTSEAAGPITLEHLYNFIPIGPMIAKGTVSGATLKDHPMAGIEAGADGALNPDVSKWTGGWLFNFSGITMDIDPYGMPFNRASNLCVGPDPAVAVPLVFGQSKCPGIPLSTYTYASYFYAGDSTLINRLPATNITVVTENGNLLPWPLPPGFQALDGTEVVVRYLDSLCPLEDRPCTVTPELNRIHLTAPLPPPICGNPEIQPLKGAWSVNPGC